MKNYHVLIVSDGTGETANRMFKAAMLQFSEDVFITRHTNIRDKKQIREIFKRTLSDHVLVVFTFVSKSLRNYTEELAQKQNASSIDVLGPTMDTLSTLFHESPVSTPGLLHRVDEQYYARVSAIEYAIRHDNNNSLADLETSDIVLIGVSRTSKTPLGIYLAQDGWKVANIPVVEGTPLPKKLFTIDQGKIVALSMDPKRLAEMRRARLRLGVKDESYADVDFIKKELEYAQSLYRETTWPVIDVTGKSVEEISQEVLDAMVGKSRTL
ncbi:MAG: pyruvate, water dikinase regulatory protein [Acidobacteriota bacterium]